MINGFALTAVSSFLGLLENKTWLEVTLQKIAAPGLSVILTVIVDSVNCTK
jgi:hypothetical protein